MRAIVTTTCKASSELMSHVNYLFNRNQDNDSKYWHFSIWNIPEIVGEMERNVKSQSSIMDNQMKGWKPVPNGNDKEIAYGMSGNKEGIEFWYQRVYEK